MKKKKNSQSTKTSPSTASEKKGAHSHSVIVRPILAVLWGIGSTYYTFSLLFDLCFYPARDLCSTPYQWLTTIPLYERLLVLTIGLPTFITDLIFEIFSIARFGETERLFLPFAVSSIVVAYLVILGINSLLGFFRKMNS
jgi:hypothetical protein